MVQSYALVTGASSGIGRALAEELARRKMNLLLVALPDSGLTQVACELRRQYRVKVAMQEIDLTEQGAPIEIFKWCLEGGYRVSLLVNNAGFGNLCSFEETEPAVMEKMMMLNNGSLIALTRLFIPELRKCSNAYILNLGSLASFLPIPNKSLYSATKSFVYAFSTSLRLELLPCGIKVSCLCPGNTITSPLVQANRTKARGGGRFSQLPDAVAREAIAGMLRGKGRIIPGWHNRLLFFAYKILPAKASSTILRWIFDPRIAGSGKNRWPIFHFPAGCLAFR